MVITLETAPSSIKRLIVDGYELTKTEAETISHHIEHNLFDSLIELSLDFLFVDYLVVEANRTFANVKSLSIIGGHQSDALRLHEIFPNFQKLHIFRTNERPLQSLHRRYSQLIDLSFYALDHDNVNLQPLIRSNPQIQSLKLNSMPSIATLECIEQHLPNLKTLNIQCDERGCHRQYPANAGDVRLRQVRNFIINMGQLDAQHIPIEFEQLESLEIDVKSPGNATFRLIKDNAFVRKLALPSLVMAKDFERIVDIAVGMPALTDITLTWWEKFDSVLVHRLFDEATHLYVAKFIVDNFCRERFLTIAPRRWNLANTAEVDLDGIDRRAAEFTYFRKYWYAVTLA